MESNLCVICFVDDNSHLEKVGEKGLETYNTATIQLIAL